MKITKLILHFPSTFRRRNMHKMRYF